MSKIKIVKGDLFGAPEGSIIAHACNAQGVWGSGIAKLFRDRYPFAYTMYNQYCRNHKPEEIIGTCLLVKDGKHTVAALITSKDYGPKVDPPHEILIATRFAVDEMIRANAHHLPIALCKINSGLFNVPWAHTEMVLDSFDTEMTVYEL